MTVKAEKGRGGQRRPEMAGLEGSSLGRESCGVEALGVFSRQSQLGLGALWKDCSLSRTRQLRFLRVSVALALGPELSGANARSRGWAEVLVLRVCAPRTWTQCSFKESALAVSPSLFKCGSHPAGFPTRSGEGSGGEEATSHSFLRVPWNEWDKVLKIGRGCSGIMW